MNLGNSLKSLGEREQGTKRLEEAQSAYHESLKELTPEAAPYLHELVVHNLGLCNEVLSERR
jgi:hypothetical protein